MRKLSKLLLTGVVALGLGLTACNNDTPEVDTKGGTHARVTVQQAKVSGTRAVDDGQQDVVGTAEEDTVTGGYLFFKANPGIGLTMKNTTPGAAGTNAIWSSQVIETAPMDDVTFAILLNNRLTLNLVDYSPTKTFSIDDLDTVIGANGFLMTSTAEAAANTKDIVAGVSEADAGNIANIDDETQNNFNLDVERVVAKVQVHKPAGPYSTDGVPAGKIDFDSLTYAMAGSAKESYLFRDNAGSRVMDETSKRYAGFTSAIHTLAKPELQKMSDAGLNTNFNARSFNDHAATNSLASTAGIYFLENSTDQVVEDAGELFYNRIAYVKVYATFLPSAGQKIEDGVLVEATRADFEAPKPEYSVSVTDEWHDANPYLDYTGAAGAWMLVLNEDKGTFYVGADGIFYYGLDAARMAGNATAKKYVGGKMVYKTPANSQMNEDKTFTQYADTRRNNIYHLTIDGFAGLGENYDWTDPEDPNIPKPGDNPDEPETPDDPVDPLKTFMRVHAKVLNWNLVNRNVTLK